MNPLKYAGLAVLFAVLSVGGATASGEGTATGARPFDDNLRSASAALSVPVYFDSKSDADGQQVVQKHDSDGTTPVALHWNGSPVESQLAVAEASDSEASDLALPTAVQVAQTSRYGGEGDTVRGRARPDYQPLGVRAGSFVISPQLVLTEQFEDNVFRTEDDRSADLISIVSPNVAVASDWGRHQITFESGADVGFYVDNTDENYQDYFGALGGRLDIYDDAFVALDLDAEHGHQGRGDPDDVGALEPTEFNQYHAGLTGFHRRGLFSGTLSSNFTKLDYFDDTTAGGPTGVTGEINNDDRDRFVYDNSLRIGYEIVPEYEAFVGGGVNVINYESSTDDAGIDRDSHGYSVVAGVAIDFTNLIFGDFYAGYLRQIYDDSALENIDGINFGADITWNVTALTTIIGSLSRTVKQTAIIGSSGRLVSAAGVQVDHELLRNVIIGLNVGVEQDEFESETFDRTDYNLTAGVTVDYYLNRNLFLGAGYGYDQRISEGSDDDYVLNTAFVRGGARF